MQPWLSDPGEDLGHKTKSAGPEPNFTPFTPFVAVWERFVFSQCFWWSECTAMAAVVVYFQLNDVFPSWRRGFESPLPLHSFVSNSYGDGNQAIGLFSVIDCQPPTLTLSTT
jgi:hypothetical protein